MNLFAAVLLAASALLAPPAVLAQGYPDKPIRLVVPFPAGGANVIETVTWFGLYGPRGVPPEVVNRLSNAINQALQDADVRERLARLGIEPAGGTPQQFEAMTHADRAKWKKIITDRKLTAD